MGEKASSQVSEKQLSLTYNWAIPKPEMYLQLCYSGHSGLYWRSKVPQSLSKARKIHMRMNLGEVISSKMEHPDYAEHTPEL